MKPADLVLRELATIVDMEEISMFQQDMNFDEVDSLCRSVVSRLGRERGRWVLVRLAHRLRARSPELYRRVLRNAVRL